MLVDAKDNNFPSLVIKKENNNNFNTKYTVKVKEIVHDTMKEIWNFNLALILILVVTQSSRLFLINILKYRAAI